MKASVSLRVCLVLVLFAIASNTARAGSATLGWQPSPSAGVVAYRIYYGTSSTEYQWSVTIANTTTAQVNGLAAGVTYYFAVKALDGGGVESVASNEVAYTVPSSQASSSSAATGLSNISTRSEVLTGDGATIGGFVIAATDSHTVLIRGLGPTLSSFGIPGV